MSWVPVQACTLPTAEQPLRVAEFDALFARSVRGVERAGPQRAVLTLDGGPDLAAQVQELADRESSCCSFFAFTVDEAAGAVSLQIEVPTAHVAVLDGLVARAEAAALRS